MTRQAKRFTATVAVLLAASGAVAGFAIPAEKSGNDTTKTATVIAGAAAHDAATIAQAKASTQDVRVVHDTADQLGATHLLAAKGYDVVVTIGVDERIAVEPVAERYPHTRFVAAEANNRPGQR